MAFSINILHCIVCGRGDYNIKNCTVNNVFTRVCALTGWLAGSLVGWLTVCWLGGL